MLGVASTVAIGNGGQDRWKLAAAAVGIALRQRMSGVTSSLACLDILATGIHDAPALLMTLQRVMAIR